MFEIDYKQLYSVGEGDGEMTFNQRLKELREDAQLTQVRLAEQLGVVQQTVAKWEKGTASPDPETLVRLADVFGVSADYLLGRSDRKEGYRPAPETMAAHATEGAEEVSAQRMEEIITQAYRLIMANKKQP